MHNLMPLDLAFVAAFIFLWLGVIVFRRFHHYQGFVKPEDIGPTAWGLYASQTAAEKPPARR